MEINRELAQRMLEAIDKIKKGQKLTKKIVVGHYLPNKKKWWLLYGESAKRLGIPGPNLLKAAMVLTPELVEPIYAEIPDASLEEAHAEASRRGMLDLGVTISKNHWLRKIANSDG